MATKAESVATNEKLCPSGHPNHPDDQFCGVCGQILAGSGDSPRTTILYCTSGHPASPYDLHCGQCGAPVRPPIVPDPPTRPNPPTRPVVRPFPTAIPPRRSNTTRNALIVGGIAVLCIILVVAGGSAVKASRSRSGGSSSAASRIRSESELSRMLLTDADLTYDWSEESYDSSSDDSDFCIESDQAFNGLRSKYPGITDAKAKFSRSDSGPIIDELLLSSGTKKLFSEMKAAIQLCNGKSWTIEDETGTYDVEMENASLPKFGDESISIKLTVGANLGAANVWFVLVRVDDLVVRYALTELTYQAFGGKTNGSARFTKDEVASIVRAGVERIRRYS